MLVVRRRLIFWLFKAYIKKSKKILIFSFLAGLMVFFAFLFGAKYIRAIITLNRAPVIGITGAYQRENLPPIVLSKLSKGLTRVEKDGSVQLDLAESYKISNAGKTYTFKLKDNQIFNDGSRLESKDISYNFSDVAIEKPDNKTIVFKLKDAYAPFLTTVSKPIFKKGYVGVGDYFIRNIDLNGDFVQEITLGLKKNRFDTVKFIFYPTDQALKTAFMLGEVTHANGIRSTDFRNYSFDKFPETKVQKNVNYTSLVTLFYNTADGTLSDRKVRLGLDYALPNDFEFGKKAYLPYPHDSVYYNADLEPRVQDLDHAKVLLPDQELKLTLTTLRKYRETADLIAKDWEKIGIKTKIEEVDQIPDRFQILLSDFSVPKDSDQYPLWHTQSVNNITRYKNLRIDKLLEDGRKTVNVDERKKIYTDFQRFLLEDMPASFLYFPYEYEVKRE